MNTIHTTARALGPGLWRPLRFSDAAQTPVAATGKDRTATADRTTTYSLALPAACWVLRVSIALMCWGLAAKVLYITYTAGTEIFEALFIHEIGAGIVVESWSEETAKAVDEMGAFYYFMAGLALLVVPAVVAAVGLVPPLKGAAQFARRWGLLWQAPLLVAVSLWTLLIALGDTFFAGRFMVDYTVLAHFARILTPLGLIFWLAATARPRDLPHTTGQTVNTWLGEQILRWGIGTAFVVHGLEAFWHNPHFTDLILMSDLRLFHYGIKQAAAEQALTVIGIVDILVGVSIVIGRFRSVALWLAFWGIVTAFSRMTAQGWEKYPEVLLRAAHAGAPLALFVYWQWGRPRKQRPTPTASPAEEPTP